MGRTVAELEETITEAELAEWMIFYQKEPFLPQRVEYGAARVCQVLAQIHKDPKKGGKPKLADFLVFEDAGAKQQSKITDPDAVKNMFLAMSKTKVVKKEKGDGNNNR